ncbi:helix-turn-helix domain-containing protein [Azospirillum sp. sgz302134]
MNSPSTPLPVELAEPPIPPNGQLVPGSRYSDADWAMAAHRMAAGWPMMQVARAMGCHRNTLWRAYYVSAAFRERVEWERACLRREASARVRSLSHVVASQIEQAVTRGDMQTIRWLADRLGLAALPALDGAAQPPGPDLADRAEPVPEAELPDSVPLDWQDEFAPDLPVPR